MARSPLLLDLFQTLVEPGDVAGNLARAQSLIQESDADVVVFPELALTGYLVGDLWLLDGWVDDACKAARELAQCAAAARKTLVLGSPWLVPDALNKDGRSRKFNAGLVFQATGQPAPRPNAPSHVPLPAGVQPKTLLPTYRFFDDERYFLSLRDLALDAGCDLADLLHPFEIEPRPGERWRLGVQLCEDLWCSDYRRHGASLSTAALLVEHGAELIVNLSASPWTYGKNAARDRRVSSVLDGCPRRVPFLYVNRAGAENCGDNVVTFDGGTTAYHPDGQIACLLPDAYAEGVLRVAVEPDGTVRSRDPHPSARPQRAAIAEKHACLRAGLRHTRSLTGLRAPRFVISLSGGVDSSVVACLLAQEFGADSVTGLTMPGPFTSAATLDNARHVAHALGLRLLEVPLHDALSALQRTIDAAIPGEDGSKGLAIENDQARLRGSGLQAGIAARLGALFTNNGNKLEMALGYCTLYGDMTGFLCPIADLLKSEVFELARLFNQESSGPPPVPENLLPDALYRFPGVPPTAELAADQVDPMKFGYHDALLDALTTYRRVGPEDMAHWFEAGDLASRLRIDPALLERYGLVTPRAFFEDLEWFCPRVYRSVFKRVQAPPIIVTGKGAWGYDIRESIGPSAFTRGYNAVKARLLG